MVLPPLPLSTLLLSAALAAPHTPDPWGRPAHLRMVAAPPETWADLSAPQQRVRVWWDVDPTSPPIAVQALVGDRWRTLETDIAPGWVSPALPTGTPLRLRAAGAWTRWTAPLVADPWASPVDLARIAGPPGALLDGGVGQIAGDGVLVWASTLNGGLVRVTPGRTEVEVLTRWHGLPDDRVIALDVSPERGQVLVGTARGAALLDTTGRPLRVWDRELPDPYVQSVLIDDDGTLWLGTYQGLARVDLDGTVTAVLEPWSVFSLTDIPDAPGEVWVGYDGLRRINRAGETLFPPPPPPPPEDAADAPAEDLSTLLAATKVYAVQSVEGGGLWLADEARGVLHLSPEAGTLLPVDGYPATEVYGLAPGGWVAGAKAGLVGPGGQHLGRKEGLPSGTVWSVVAQGDALWVGTRWGLAQVSAAGAVQAWPLSEWPAELQADALLLEPDGALLGGPLGLWGVGAAQTRWADLLAEVGAPVVALLRRGPEVWAIGGQKAVRRLADGQLVTLALPGEATAAAVWSDTVWVATEAAVWRYEGTNDRFVEGAALPGVQRLAASATAGGAIWAADAEGHVHRMVFGTVRKFGQPGPTLSVAPGEGYVCLGTTSGLERLDIETGDVADVLGMQDYSVRVTAVAAAPGGGCWFGAEDGTVGRVLPGDRVDMVRLGGGEAPDPTAIVLDPADEDVAWVLTTTGTWRVRLP